MPLSIDHIKEQATEAGASIGKAHDRIRQVIIDMHDAGMVGYASDEHKAARGAFADAAAKSGASRNSGMTLYARAYDSLIADGACPNLQPRPRKGVGRNASAPAAGDASDGTSGAHEATPAPRELTPAEIIAAATPRIEAEAVARVLAQSGITLDFLTAVAQEAGEQANKAKKLKKDNPASPIVKSLLQALQDIGRACEAAIDASDAMQAAINGLPRASAPSAANATSDASDASDATEQQAAA